MGTYRLARPAGYNLYCHGCANPFGLPPHFGIQELGYGPHMAEIFPGSPVYDGALWLNEVPGHGVSFNEEAARSRPRKTHQMDGDAARRNTRTPKLYF